MGYDALKLPEPRIVRPEGTQTCLLSGILTPIKTASGMWLIEPYEERISEGGALEWHILGRYMATTPRYAEAVWTALRPIGRSMFTFTGLYAQ